MACIKKRNGRLVLDFYDQRNRRVMQRLPEGTTQKQAQRKFADIIGQVDRGAYMPKKTVPKFEKVAADWLKVKRGIIRHSTTDNYEGILNHFLLPFLGHMNINRINVSVIEKLVPHVTAEYPEKKMIWDAETKYRHSKKLKERFPTMAAYIAHRRAEGIKEAVPAPESFRKMFVVIGQVMKFAVRHRLIEYNPVPLIEKPKKQKTREADFLQPHEIRALLDNANEGKYRTLFLVAVFTGLRQGELLGLKWGDVDWLNKQVSVNRTYNHKKFMEPKSKTSYRRVDLAPIVVAELKKWKLQCPKSKLDLVFSNDVGEPMDSDNMVDRGYYPALRRAGLRHVNFHGLRHTYASLQIDNDVNLKYLQQQMGHSSINVTLDTYSHLLKPTNQQAAVKLENTIFEKNGKLLVNFPDSEQEKSTRKAPSA
jgi:integrase